MKIYIKLRNIMITMLVVIMFSTSVSYATEMTSNPQIKSRGLTFNTGMSSDQIRLLKDFFRATNYQNVPWGYGYDSRTKELVRSYQKSNGLGVDSIAGSGTLGKINKEISDKKLDIGLRIPYTNVKGEMLIINKSSNTLYFLKDGNIQESYPVATGKTTDLTPNGRFKIVMKLKDPRWGGGGVSDPIEGGKSNNPLGARWLGISHGGGGKYGVHGNANARSIGTYASLGCVRMFNEDVKKLYEKVKTGTPIWIGPEDLLEGYGVKFKYNNLPRPKDPKPQKPAEPTKPVIPEKPQPKPVDITILLNGEKLKLENQVLNKEGTTYYPFREILEFIEAEVIWDDENKKATGILNEIFVEFQLGSNKYVDSKGNKSMPKGKEVFAMKGKTYVPIRNLMESLGFDVVWDPSTDTVTLTDHMEESVE